jgi:hypothetical protein
VGIFAPRDYFSENVLSSCRPELVDAANLATPDAAHMQKMILTLIDDNHHTEEWTLVDHGKEHKEIFDLHRKS